MWLLRDIYIFYSVARKTGEDFFVLFSLPLFPTFCGGVIDPYLNRTRAVLGKFIVSCWKVSITFIGECISKRENKGSWTGFVTIDFIQNSVLIFSSINPNYL